MREQNTKLNKWARGLIAAAIFAAASIFIWSIWGSKIVPEKLPTPVDSLNQLESMGAPDFALESLAGGKVRLSDFKGKIVVLNFWATWCAPCVTEFPSMVRMANELKDKVVLITVAADERKEDVLAFIDSFKGYGSNIVHLWDPKLNVAKSFGTEKLPETYILKSDLKLAKKVASSLEWDKGDVLEYLKGL